MQNHTVDKYGGLYSESTEPIDAFECWILLIMYIYTEGYSKSTESIDAVNILPLVKFEPMT